jgi:hypothetical protein
MEISLWNRLALTRLAILGSGLVIGSLAKRQLPNIRNPWLAGLSHDCIFILKRRLGLGGYKQAAKARKMKGAKMANPKQQ